MELVETSNTAQVRDARPGPYPERVSPEVIVSIITGLLLIVGVVGIVVPVLPGSITILGGLLLWAIVVGGPTGWVVFAVGGLLVLAGMAATYVLTGRTLKRHRIPNRSVIIGLIAGIVGMFLLPGFGLLIGFVVGLFVAEYLRVRDVQVALRTSWQAIKATGFGMLVELTCATLAVTTWVIGLFVHFS